MFVADTDSGSIPGKLECIIHTLLHVADKRNFWNGVFLRRFLENVYPNVIFLKRIFVASYVNTSGKLKLSVPIRSQYLCGLTLMSLGTYLSPSFLTEFGTTKSSRAPFTTVPAELPFYINLIE